MNIRWRLLPLIYLVAAAFASPASAQLNAAGFQPVTLNEAQVAAVDRAVNAWVPQPDGTRFFRPYGAIIAREGIFVCGRATFVFDTLRDTPRLAFIVLLHQGKAETAELIGFPGSERDSRAIARRCLEGLGIDI